VILAHASACLWRHLAFASREIPCLPDRRLVAQCSAWDDRKQTKSERVPGRGVYLSLPAGGLSLSINLTGSDSRMERSRLKASGPMSPGCWL